MTVEIDPMPFYEQRVIVLIETRPQSNRYNQVLLNREQVLGLTQCIGKDIKQVEGSGLIQSYIEQDKSREYSLDSEIKTITILK